MPKTSRINRDNWREQISLLMDGIQRSHPGWEAVKAVNAEGIGNLLREFGEKGAEEWFGKAVAWYRQITPEPTIKVALTLWKTGDEAAVRQLCAEVLAFHRGRLEGIQQGQPLAQSQVFHDPTVAHVEFQPS